MTPTRYPSRRDPWLTALFGLVILGLLGLAWATPGTSGAWGYLLLLAPAALLAWIWADTGYHLGGGWLRYRSGPWRGQVPVAAIREVVVPYTAWVSTHKPALATRGLLVRYHRFDDLYISPARPEEFIRALLDQNPAIEVIRTKPISPQP
jgi:hypothetical protein